MNDILQGEIKVGVSHQLDTFSQITITLEI